MRIITKAIYNTAQIMRKFGFDFKAEQNERVIEMNNKIASLGGGIDFKIDQYPDGSWTAESVNVDGIITGGDNIKDSSAIIRDAIFTYYRVPPQYCRDEFLHNNNEPVTLRQKVYV